jgi:N-acetyl-anhydromuramyl-L-alanine amidase AmpD
MGMAKSAEYPDLPWVSPAAYGSGRDGKAVRYIVIHYTAGSERASSAEDGAAYDARRTDGTSTHYFVDQDSIVQCVRTSDRANAARARGNRLGIQYELCGTQQSRAQWLDAASRATLQIAARQVARDCVKYDIPVRRLTVAETRRAWTEFPSGPRGIVGHVDCTQAYPEDGGDHTDPGTEFPWDVFLQMVQDEISGDDMTKAEFLALLKDADVRNALATGVWQTDGVIKAPATAGPNADGTPNTYWSASSFINGAYVGVGSIRTDIANLRSLVTSGFSAVMAQLKAEGSIPAGATPEEIAALVVAALAARLQA